MSKLIDPATELKTKDATSKEIEDARIKEWKCPSKKEDQEKDRDARLEAWEVRITTDNEIAV